MNNVIVGSPVKIFVQTNPEYAGLVWGAMNLVFLVSTVSCVDRYTKKKRLYIYGAKRPLDDRDLHLADIKESVTKSSHSQLASDEHRPK